MNINIKGINIDITDALKEHVNNSFQHIIDGFEGFVVEDISVTLESNPSHKTNSHIVKARVPVKGNDILSESVGDDMYHAISEASDNAVRQIRKFKGKTLKH